MVNSTALLKGKRSQGRTLQDTTVGHLLVSEGQKKKSPVTKNSNMQKNKKLKKFQFSLLFNHLNTVSLKQRRMISTKQRQMQWKNNLKKE